MMEDITQDERQNYFSQIMKEMEYETNKDIYISIENIQKNYDVLYNLNKLALEDLKNIVRKNIETRGEQIPNTNNKNTRTKTTSEEPQTKQTNNINNKDNENINQNTQTNTYYYKDNKYNDIAKKYDEFKNNIEIFLNKYRKTIVPAILMSLLTIVFIIALNTSNSDGNSNDDTYDYQQEESR